MTSLQSFFSELIIPYQNIFKNVIVRDLPKVYAHKKEGKKPENLKEHSDKTLEVFQRYVEKCFLKSVIDNLEKKLYGDLKLEGELDLREFTKISWMVIVNSIYHHDLGKLNKNFQRERLANTSPLRNFVGFRGEIHSKYGKYLLDYAFTYYYWGIENDRLKSKILYLVYVLTSIIERHHTPLKDVNSQLVKEHEQAENGGEWLEWANKHMVRKVPLSQALYICRQNIKKGYIEIDVHENTHLFYLYKLLYSLLVVSDYYATHCYEHGLNPDDIDINTIDEGIITEMENTFYEKEYNQELSNREDVLRAKKVKDITDLNELRSKLLLEASDNLGNLVDNGHRILFLNAPTGSGKTNISMKLALDLLHYDTSLRRVYYVFPYINIIEQNYEVILSTLSPNSNLVSKIYSYNEWDFSLEDKSEELEYYINQRFLNYPICIISNVNFFNTFIKNGKKVQYKLANFANSVVVIDEVQTLPNDRWQFFAKLLNDISENYNIYFIVMSATLPDLSRFLNNGKVAELIEKPGRYQRHEAFKRSSVKFVGHKSENGEYFIKEIESREGSTGENLKVLFVVNTVRNSYRLYKTLDNELANFDVYLLNTTIPSLRRKEIIKAFEKDPTELEQNILLVSTQSIEAGVDIDCHFGFREIAPLDSIEQIGGRINRERKRSPKESELLVFDFRTARWVYKSDARLKVQEMLNESELLEIVNRKTYSKFYSRVIDFLREKEQEIGAIYVEFIRPMEKLELGKLADPSHDYIRDESITFFVTTLNLIEEFGNNALTEGEKGYLESRGLNPAEGLHGTEVWDLYKKILTENRDNFTKAQKLQSIINKFTFSVVNRPIDHKMTLRERVQDDVNAAVFEAIGGIVKPSSDFIEKVGFTVEEGLNPAMLNDYYKRIDANNII